MAARKNKAGDPVADLEAQIEKLRQDLEKAREKKLKSLEREVVRATRGVDTSKQKLTAAREKLKTAKAALKTGKTAAATSRAEKASQQVDTQKAALGSSRETLASAKAELANLKQSYKLALTVAKAARQAEQGALVKGTKSRKTGSRSAVASKSKTRRVRQVKKLLQSRTAAASTAGTSDFDPTRPSLFGDD